MSYNASMNKVDKYNQSILYINLLRRAKRWDQRPSIFFLEVIVHNTHIIWKLNNIEKKFKYDFFVIACKAASLLWQKNLK